MYKKIIFYFCLFLLLFVIQAALLGIVIYQTGLSQTKSYIAQVLKRAKEDIQYHNGKWDTTAYNADPKVPGDAHPVYILTADGFVIDRWQPIHGFLDTSDFKHLITFTQPQTIDTVANQKWRIFSKPIYSGSDVIGVITVSSFNPDPELIDAIDIKLHNVADTISQKLTIQNNTIRADKLDARTISFDVSFQVVDSFNRIIAKNNNYNSIDRIPNFVDSSYVAQELQTKPIRIITDAQTNERFLIVSSAILDKENHPLGIILVGKSLSYIYEIVYIFILTSGIIAFALAGGLSLLFQSKAYKKEEKESIEHLYFDSKESIMRINHHRILIPYATNQYILCQALFSTPRKRWEVDELLEKFGEEVNFEHARKVYDAMLLLNKKFNAITSDKIIVHKDKIYMLNPHLIGKIGTIK